MTRLSLVTFKIVFMILFFSSVAQAQPHLNYTFGARSKAAIAKYDDSLKKDPSNLTSKYFRAISYYQSGLKAKAIEEAQDLKLQNYPGSADLIRKFH